MLFTKLDPEAFKAGAQLLHDELQLANVAEVPIQTHNFLFGQTASRYTFNILGCIGIISVLAFHQMKAKTQDAKAARK